MKNLICPSCNKNLNYFEDINNESSVYYVHNHINCDICIRFDSNILKSISYNKFYLYIKDVSLVEIFQLESGKINPILSFNLILDDYIKYFKLLTNAIDNVIFK